MPLCLQQIRVLGYTRVTKSFDARRLCDRRRYEYILPAFAFDPACCRGEGDPPAHVGAAGNIVDKHAGRELDLEAALDTLPDVDQRNSLQPQVGAQESARLHQQRDQDTEQTGGKADPGTVPRTVSVENQLSGLRAAQGSEQTPAEPQQQHENGARVAIQHSKDACQRDGDSALSLCAQPEAGSSSGNVPAEQRPPFAVLCSSTHVSQSTKALDTVLRQCVAQQRSNDVTAPARSSQPMHPWLRALKTERTQPGLHGAPSNGELPEGPGRRHSGGRAAQRHPACGHAPAEYRRVRFTAEQQARLNKVLAGYEGTHNFHNYTIRVTAGDPAAMRYILSFKCLGTMEIQVCTHLSSFIQRLAYEMIRMLCFLHLMTACGRAA